MKKTYKVNGMHCTGCATRVQKILSSVEGVKTVNVTLEPPVAELETEKDVDKKILNEALYEIGDYTVEEA